MCSDIYKDMRGKETALGRVETFTGFVSPGVFNTEEQIGEFVYRKGPPEARSWAGVVVKRESEYSYISLVSPKDDDLMFANAGIYLSRLVFMSLNQSRLGVTEERFLQVDPSGELFLKHCWRMVTDEVIYPDAFVEGFAHAEKRYLDLYSLALQAARNLPLKQKMLLSTEKTFGTIFQNPQAR